MLSGSFSMIAERREPVALTRKRGAPQALAARVRIVLAAAEGLDNKPIAAGARVRPATAGLAQAFRRPSRDALERRTHGYKRNETASPFAAVDVVAGTVMGQRMPRHSVSGFREFLDEFERNVPSDLDVHIVIDNYGTHTTELVVTGSQNRPAGIALHPTPVSWINRVERFFALLAGRALKRGAFPSVGRPRKGDLSLHRRDQRRPQPFCSTKTADQILASIQRLNLRTLEAEAYRAKLIQEPERCGRNLRKAPCADDKGCCLRHKRELD